MTKPISIILILLFPVFVFSQNIEVIGGIITDSIYVNSGLIRNVADPTSALDAANKAYVDRLEAQVLELLLVVGIRDIDGNKYDIVKIGTQTWMKENLRVTKYNDGTPLLEEKINSNWSNLNSPAYCWYDNIKANGDIYGALYNYYSVADTNSLNVCPVGWHVPSDAEWDILRTNIDPTAIDNNNSVGGRMKEAGMTHWISPNEAATNESGFTGLPGGNRKQDGAFDRLGRYAYWCSSTQLGASSAWNRYLTNFSGAMARSTENKSRGMSVRCLKD